MNCMREKIVKESDQNYKKVLIEFDPTMTTGNAT